MVGFEDSMEILWRMLFRILGHNGVPSEVCIGVLKGSIGPV